MLINHFKKIAWKYRLSSDGNVLENLNRLRSEEFLKLKELNHLRNKKLEELLSHAYNYSPYYRKILMEYGVVNGDETIDLKKFQSLPLLDKNIIKKNYESLKSEDLNEREWYKNTSGGSTGEPAVFLQDKKYKEWNSAVPILFDQWTGTRLGEKKVILWGSEKDLGLGKESFKKNLGIWLRNEVILNSYKMDNQDMELHVQKINESKPVQIVAYAESIYELARFIEKNKISVYSPKAIITTAGTLFTNMREVIERVFKAPVFNRYGSREVGGIACECNSHKGLHVSSTQYIEILDDEGNHAKPGESGEIVVTSLTNFAMPLIRYKIGDIGMWAETPCTCGRNLPLLKEVTGRSTDLFVTESGSKVHPGYFRRLFYYKEWINKYQIVQEEINYIRILVVKEKVERDLSIEEELIVKEISKVMGRDCKVKFEYIDDIPPSESGKYRFTVSKVNI